VPQPPRHPDEDDVAQAAAAIRRLLAAVEDGPLTADSGLIARLEGALLALDAVNEPQPDT
jgi:hypothetical protein